MSFYNEIKKKILLKNKEKTEDSIENVWSIFKESCQELNIDNRDDIDTYSFIFSLTKDNTGNELSIIFYFHIQESEDPNEIDESFTFGALFNLNKDASIDSMEESEVEYGEMQGSLNTSIKLIEECELFKVLKNNTFSYTLKGNNN